MGDSYALSRGLERQPVTARISARRHYGKWIPRVRSVYCTSPGINAHQLSICWEIHRAAEKRIASPKSACLLPQKEHFDLQVSKFYPSLCTIHLDPATQAWVCRRLPAYVIRRRRLHLKLVLIFPLQRSEAGVSFSRRIRPIAPLRAQPGTYRLWCDWQHESRRAWNSQASCDWSAKMAQSF